MLTASASFIPPLRSASLTMVGPCMPAGRISRMWEDFDKGHVAGARNVPYYLSVTPHGTYGTEYYVLSKFIL
jgi:hypothetical protein